MRFDSIGLFWEDQPTGRSAQKYERPMPKIPETGWTPPSSFPDLSNAVTISLDTETYDPELLDYGPGWARGKGHLVGVSIGAVDSRGNIGKWYFPFAHETQKELNLPKEPVIDWLRNALANPAQPKVGANLQYDIGWLRQEGVEVSGELVDVQYAESLLNEASKVSLETLAQKYLGEGKESNLLYQWLGDWFGGEPTANQRKWIYRAPPSLVGPYAESDADLPLRLAAVMYPLLVKENLLSLFQMECRIIRLMVSMRFAGVSVNVPRAEELRDKLALRLEDLLNQIKQLIGFEVNIYASDSLAKAFTALGLPFSTTAKGNPSFTRSFLETVEHPLGDLIREARKCDKLRGTFIESYILNSHINGKIYCQFHQLRGDAGGTRSGRFSSSTPNLQNIPSRDDILAPLIRGIFIPDDGHLQWRKYDYSQIEYRMLIEFATGAAGDAIRDFFRKFPDTDYHVYAQEVVKELTGVEIARKPIKTINFGLIYGMGAAALAEALGMTKKEATALINSYFQGVPFAKPTMESAMQEAQLAGVITTILGRKSRFDLWEPAGYGKAGIAIPYDRALRKYGHQIQRAYTHKALNRKLQGSAADLMKAAMLRCWEDGVFDYIGVPRLTVHDELDFSDPGGKDDGFREMRRIMETALPQLKVPIRADGDAGPDWGHVEKILEE